MPAKTLYKVRSNFVLVVLLGDEMTWNSRMDMVFLLCSDHNPKSHWLKHIFVNNLQALRKDRCLPVLLASSGEFCSSALLLPLDALIW